MKMNVKTLLCGMLTVVGVVFCVQKIGAEIYWTQFQKGDLSALERSINIDRGNSLHQFYAAIAHQKDPLRSQEYVHEALYRFNGDIVLWTIWFTKGQNEAATGNILGAKQSFQKAQYYWPKFDEAGKASAQMDEIIKSGKPIMIKFGDEKK